MKYTTEEALEEIRKRKEKITEKRNRRMMAGMTAAAAVLTAALVALIGLFSGEGMTYSDSVYGSFLLSREAGGYVLAAVIAFVLGVVVTLLCLKWKKLRREKENSEGDAQ